MLRSLMAVAAAALALISCAACDPQKSSSGSCSSQGDQVFPCDDWDHVDASAAGFDESALRTIAADARADKSTCLAVIKDGKIAAEWNWRGTDADSATNAYSATKSYTSTLVGIAQAEGKLDVDDKASKYIPRWRNTDSADVTIADLLSMDSGRHWSPSEDYRGLTLAKDQTAYAVGLGQDAAPGTAWVYNNSAVQDLEAVLAKATGESPADYARKRLLDPIGMGDSAMGADRAGNTTMYADLESSCEDMARFGYLFLHHGRWNGHQIVPSAWVKAATGKPSQDLNAAYGYLWWLNREGTVLDPRQPTTGHAGSDKQRTRLVPGAPSDMYWALGLGGQVIQVDPGSDTVVVRMGTARSDYGPGRTAKVVTDALKP
ncbi:MAG TPA: serine hydrolase [Stackebrandtia sp.]|uniref:serine hydrolase domain-containing protein n=1 Tax=Stackebrandtia sp. TaxID=2023065 RepID=UPI002D5EA44D|nr:serine hydrolase [Stackebrandtia sp.]HZE38253.1 serine hydrolase [Stackebrandtia sp.]